MLRRILAVPFAVLCMGLLGAFASASASAEVLPTAVTGAASEVTATSVRFEGSVNPNGETVYYEYFEYGLDTKYENGQAWGNQWWVTGNSEYPVLAWAGPLEPNATYHYRLAAVGTNGNGYGEDRMFSTLPAPPGVSGGPAAPVEVEAATLHGWVNPENSPTGYWFEYGTTSSYGSSTSEAGAGGGYGSQEVSAGIAGLAPDTVYHYRVAASNGVGGVQYGPDETFKTPLASVPAASNVTGAAATLEGAGDVLGSGTYRFEYGTDTAYGSQTPQVTAAPVSGDQTLAASLAGLAPATTYHFRLAIACPNGSVAVGPDGTFTTWPAPDVVTGQATGVSAGTAVLNGTVDAHGHAGTYMFVVKGAADPASGIGNSVYRVTAAQPLAGLGPAAVSAAIGDLPAGQTYEAVLAATVGGVTSYGSGTVFTTSKLAALVPRTVTVQAYPPVLDGAAVLGGIPVSGSSFAVLGALARGSLAAVTVSVPGPGRLAVTGAGFKPASRSVSAAGVYGLRAKLSKAAARRHRLKVRLTVTFTPAGGSAVPWEVLVVFKRGGHR